MKDTRHIPSYPSITRLQEALTLRSLSARTRAEYVRYVRKLAAHFDTDPEALEEARARQYLLYLKEQKHYAPSSMRIAASALRFLYHEVLGRDWKLFDLVRSPDRQRLPVVLARAEVAALIAHAREPRFRTAFRLIYSCGLRVGEAVKIEVGDIHTARHRLHIREAKGGKDRYVPLPSAVLTDLRGYWSLHRHPRLLFPALGRGWRERALVRARQAAGPMSVSSLQLAFRQVCASARIKRNATLHTLRHSYATHLLEEGVSLRQIASYLGHSSLDTTVIYTHLTAVSEARALEAVEKLSAATDC